MWFCQSRPATAPAAPIPPVPLFPALLPQVVFETAPDELFQKLSSACFKGHLLDLARHPAANFAAQAGIAALRKPAQVGGGARGGGGWGRGGLMGGRLWGGRAGESGWWLLRCASQRKRSCGVGPQGIL